MTSCGLFLMDAEYNSIIMFRKKPYLLKHRRMKHFIEQYYIPRGKKIKKETTENCAIREFVEETRFIPKRINLFKNPFKLVWQDCGVEYEYLIFFGLTNNLNNPQNFITEGDGEAFLKITKHLGCKITNFEYDVVLLLKFEDYIRKLNSILQLYEKSNYNEFINWVYEHLKFLSTDNCGNNV